MSIFLLPTFPILLLYLFVQGITPGPANLCSLETAMRYGTRAAVRQWAGLVLGFLIVSFASVGVVLGSYSWFEQLLPALSALGAVYVLWLAWTLVRPAHDGGKRRGEPTVASGVVEQVLNAKIALMCLTALLAYVVPFTQDIGDLAACGLLMPATGTACNLLWIILGAQLQGAYKRHERIASAVMAAALVLCAVAMVIPMA